MTIVLVVVTIFVVSHTESVPGGELQVCSFSNAEADSGTDLQSPALLRTFIGRGGVVVVVKTAKRSGHLPNFTGIRSLNPGNANSGYSQYDYFLVHRFVFILKSTINHPERPAGLNGGALSTFSRRCQPQLQNFFTFFYYLNLVDTNHLRLAFRYRKQQPLSRGEITQNGL